jgi:hypothetical protein
LHRDLVDGDQSRIGRSHFLQSMLIWLVGISHLQLLCIALNSCRKDYCQASIGADPMALDQELKEVELREQVT